jgi:hypothetical protein
VIFRHTLGRVPCILLIVLLTLVFGACDVVQVGSGASGAAQNPYGYRGSNGGGKATFSAMGNTATTCECWVQRIEEYEAAVLADSQGVPTKKGIAGPDLLTCSSVTWNRPGIPPPIIQSATTNLGAMMPSGKRSTASLFAAARAGGAKMHVDVQKNGTATLLFDHAPSGGPIGGASELSRRTTDLGNVFMASMQASQGCGMFGLANAMQYYVSEHHGGSAFDLATEKTNAKRLLAAAHSADALAATSMGLLASFESAASGKGDLKAIDSTIAGLAAALPVTSTASDDEVEALYAQGKAKADIFEKDLKAWAAEARAHPGAIPGVDSSQLSAKQGAPPTAASGPTLEAPSQATDASAIANGVSGLMHGDVGAVMAGAAVLFPKDSSIRTGLEGASAVLHGDVRGAIHAAAKLAPKDSKVGAVLGAVDQVISARGT